MWIFFFFYCVDTYHSKGFLVNLENTLCSSAYAPPQTVVSWCTKRHTALMVKRIPLAEVFLHKASFHVFLALLSWVTWEGSGNQVGSKARRGAEVLQQRGGQRRHTWWRHRAPQPLHPGPCSSGGLLTPSWVVTCHKAELQQGRHKKPVQLPAQHLNIAVLQSNFPSSGTSFAINYKVLRKCCVDIVKESDQTVHFLLMVVKRECFYLYWT